jgi:hypothetical protein
MKVQNNHIRPVGGRQRDGLIHVACFGDNLEVPTFLQEIAHAFPENPVVINNQNAKRHWLP